MSHAGAEVRDHVQSKTPGVREERRGLRFGGRKFAYAQRVAMSSPAVPSMIFSEVFWRTRTMSPRRFSAR